jgi:hypothetical protein
MGESRNKKPLRERTGPQPVQLSRAFERLRGTASCHPSSAADRALAGRSLGSPTGWRSDSFSCQFWSTGRGLNPRIQVLQTCALATSPPVPCHEGARNKALAPLHLGQSRSGHRRKGIKTRAACLSLLRYLVASSFLDRYHVSTFSPAPPPLTRLAASATVAGAGTITSCPGLQSAPTLTLLPSMVCNP